MTPPADSSNSTQTSSEQTNGHNYHKPDLVSLIDDGAAGDAAAAAAAGQTLDSLVGRLVSQAADSLSAEQARRLAADLTDLQRWLTSQPVIDQAKGILMAYYGIGAEAAFEVLRRWSSFHNVKVATISQQLTAAASHHKPGTPSSSALDDVINIFSRKPH